MESRVYAILKRMPKMNYTAKTRVKRAKKTWYHLVIN